MPFFICNRHINNARKYIWYKNGQAGGLVMRKKTIQYSFIFVFVILAIIVGANIFQKNLSQISNEDKDMIDSSVSKIMTLKTEKNKSFPNDKIIIYDLIGKDSKKVLELFGKPVRIDQSEYDYEWWIYNEPIEKYCQIGIENGKVVTVFVMGDQIDITPFKIGGSVRSLQSIVDINEEVDFEVDQNLYQFELTEEELATVPLVRYKDFFAQIYIDQFSDKVSSIRFLDGKTLVKMRPYALVYRGKLLSSEELDRDLLSIVEKGKEQQIFDMTNVIRIRNGLTPVEWDQATADVAYSHSKEMHDEKYFSHVSPNHGDLTNRLLNGGVTFLAAGENIAARYVDAISVVEGWQNSEGHRTTLLHKEFTHLGVGVYGDYYTQNFIKAW